MPESLQVKSSFSLLFFFKVCPCSSGGQLIFYAVTTHILSRLVIVFYILLVDAILVSSKNAMFILLQKAGFVKFNCMFLIEKPFHSKEREGSNTQGLNS
jgi:hypothetical protein